MEHLFLVWSEFAAAVKTASHILLLADYDGTLTPIVERPELARLSGSVREELGILSAKSRVSVGVISGRSLSDTRSLVGLEGIYYAGNHGLEIEGPGISYINLDGEKAQNVIRELAGKLAGELEGISGVIVQDKGLSLSVHYRLVKESKEPVVAEVVKKVAGPLAAEGKIKLFTGKKVWEMRPPIDWDKGKAVNKIQREISRFLKVDKVLTVFLGDDFTDDDAFGVVYRPEGWSVYVGGKNEAFRAEYYLDSTEQVEELLSRLDKLV